MTTGERLQNSITETIGLYKEELRRERVALNAMLKRTNCETVRDHLNGKLAEVNEELEKLGKTHFIRDESQGILCGVMHD